jgi:ethanolamine-phosphate cytidylyltransferase
MDGCFDMMHYGHCNALRQARALGDQLVVGVVSDAELTANKGPPVTPLKERSLFRFSIPSVRNWFVFLPLWMNINAASRLDNIRFLSYLVLIFYSFSCDHRMIMVNAVKWVDEVIPDAPYAITEDFMKKLFDEYNIDYIIHGDDPCVLPDGTDAYALAKKAGRYKQIKRTEGVSSTDIVG